MPLRRRLTSALVLASSLGLLPAPHADASERLTPAVSVAVQRQQIVDGINAERAKVGMPALKLHQGIDQVAQSWAEQIGQQGDTLSHNPALISQAQRAGCTVLTGENAAMSGRDTPLDASVDGGTAVSMWMGSAAHRDNMLRSDYNSIGIGVAYSHYLDFTGEDTWSMYWVADFSFCAPAPAVVTPSPAPKPVTIVRKPRVRAHR